MKAFPNWAKGCGCVLLPFIAVLIVLLILKRAYRERRGRILTREMMIDITWGIKSCQLENGRLPLQQEGQKEDLRLELSGDLLRLLLGETISGFNVRQIVYIEPPPAKDGKTGLIREGDKAPVLVDAWGKPFVVIMDTNGDKRVRNPDCDNSDPDIRKDAPQELVMLVIAFSAGPDGLHGTKDDVVSWRK